ncbi:MAG TPA: hypothetical protein VLS93_05255 [Anaeromyxobacteraceae bacterium]|nr:hypothetical protein [Anaeromyxobacteraceae bacterium]
MAVKVMVATAIANGELARPAARRPRDPAAPAKPRRRRSSVYDADGNEVFITLMCLKCQKMRPLAQFGLRRMADGAIRNQPWCKSCRSSSGAEPRRRRGSAGIEEPSLAPDSAQAPAATGPALDAQAPRPRGSLASEIAAALAAGQRR